jgi:hypothetical protein
MIKIVFAIVTALHFWKFLKTGEVDWQEPLELERQAARLREIDRHPELVTGGPSEWERRH